MTLPAITEFHKTTKDLYRARNSDCEAPLAGGRILTDWNFALCFCIQDGGLSDE